MNDKFLKPGELDEYLEKAISPEKFLKEMVKVGEIENKTKNYGADVEGLCRNATAWTILKISDYYPTSMMKVIDGTWHGKDHTWLQLEKFYIDLTLAQFVPKEADCPKLAMCKREDGKALGYEEHFIRSVEEFANIEAEANGIDIIDKSKRIRESVSKMGEQITKEPL